jgi:hypothetical protein
MVYVSGNYAYVVDGGAGLQVLDIHDPGRPYVLISLYPMML